MPRVEGLISMDDLACRKPHDAAWEEAARALGWFDATFIDVPAEEAYAEVGRVITELKNRSWPTVTYCSILLIASRMCSR
jgi:hypothetical protein